MLCFCTQRSTQRGVPSKTLKPNLHYKLSSLFTRGCPRSLPGSVVERQLHKSFCNMLPELLRFSSASRLLSLIPEETQKIHRTDACAPEPKRASLAGPSLETSLWDGWGDAGGDQVDEDKYGSSDEEDVDLSAMGL